MLYSQTHVLAQRHTSPVRLKACAKCSGKVGQALLFSAHQDSSVYAVPSEDHAFFSGQPRSVLMQLKDNCGALGADAGESSRPSKKESHQEKYYDQSSFAGSLLQAIMSATKGCGTLSVKPSIGYQMHGHLFIFILNSKVWDQRHM